MVVVILSLSTLVMINGKHVNYNAQYEWVDVVYKFVIEISISISISKYYIQ